MKKSEALPPWFMNREEKEIEALINSSIDLAKLSILWRNPKFTVKTVGIVYPRGIWNLEVMFGEADDNGRFPEQDGGFLITLSYEEIDSDTMNSDVTIETNRVFVAPNASDDTIERAVFGLLEASLAHKLGEFYFWKGCRIRTHHVMLSDLISNSREYEIVQLEKKLAWRCHLHSDIKYNNPPRYRNFFCCAHYEEEIIKEIVATNKGDK